jgi:hypothetical protein
MSIEYEYEANAYFGIHYDAEHIDTVLEIVAKSPFKGLATKRNAQHQLNNCVLYTSTNSDKDGAATKGMIFVDEMTFSGDTYDAPEETHVDLEPSEMVKRETKYKKAIGVVTDIYELIIKEFTKRKISTDELHVGWRVINCTWMVDEGSSTNSEPCSPEAEVTKPKKATATKGKSTGKGKK